MHENAQTRNPAGEGNRAKEGSNVSKMLPMTADPLAGPAGNEKRLDNASEPQMIEAKNVHIDVHEDEAKGAEDVVTAEEVESTEDHLSEAGSADRDSSGFASFPDVVLERVDSRPGTKRRASIVSRIFHSLQDEAQHKAVWITGILFLAENPGIEKLRSQVGSRLLAIPRFRSKVEKKSTSSPAYFTEVDTATIDMNYHFQTVLDDAGSLPSREDVFAYVSNMYESWMPDLDRPLWQILFVPQTQDGNAVIITRINHAIGDGVSQVEILMRMIDAEDEAAATAEEAEAARPPRKRKPERNFGPLNKAAIFAGGIYEGATALLRSPDPRNSLQHAPGGATSLKRKFAFTEKISLERIKAVKDKLQGSTVNDVLILMLNETLHRYFIEANDTAVLKGGRVTAQFPISTRGRNAEAFRGDDPCNSIAYGYLKFRFKGKGTMVDRFWSLKRDIDKIKLSPAPYVGINTIRKLAPLLSRSMLNKLALGVGDLATGQLSNVAAPQKPVHIAGARVEDMSFVILAPIALYMGLLSYNGQVNCAICLSGELEADPEDVVKHWPQVFADFEQEVLAADGVISRPRRVTDSL